MRGRRTTISCSAGALTLLAAVALRAQTAQTKTDPPAQTLFPAQVAWTLALNNELTGTPAYSGTRGFFPIEGNRLVAYDLVAGQRLWIADAALLTGAASGDDLVFLAEPRHTGRSSRPGAHASPASAGEGGPQATAADPGHIIARAHTDGAVVWRVPLDAAPSAPLVWDNGWLVVASASGSILALAGRSGDLVWRHEAGAPVRSRPALAADRVYVSIDDGRVLSLRVEDGSVVWTRKLGGAPNDILALDDRIYVGSNDNFLYALDALTGKVLWRWRTGGDVVGLPSADESRLYFVSLDNVLRALDLRTGNQRWKRALPVRPIAGPVRAGPALVVSGLTPPLRAYRMSDGTPAGELPASGEMAGPPHVFVPGVAPVLIVPTRTFASGATITALTRSQDPAIAPPAPLPTPITALPPR